MPDDIGLSLSSLLPGTRREVAILLFGAMMSFGLSRIPGVTIEPAELSDCKLSLAIRDSELVATAREVGDLKGRVMRCWDRYRETCGSPPLSLDVDVPDLWGDVDVE